MIEAIQVVRDVIIILSFVIITGTVVIVGRALLDRSRKAKTARSFAAAAVSPIKGALLALSRHARH